MHTQTETSAASDRAYSEGLQAYARGEPSKNNPYHDEWLYEHWLQGWKFNEELGGPTRWVFGIQPFRSQDVERGSKTPEALVRLWIWDRLIESVEVFCYDFVPENDKIRPYEEWIREHLTTCYDTEVLLNEMKVDKEDHGVFQILMKVEIKGWYDYWGEYDEEMYILDSQIKKMPDNWFEEKTCTLT